MWGLCAPPQMLLNVDKSFHLEIAAFSQLHGALGKARLENDIISLLPTGRQHKTIDTMTQRLTDIQRSNRYKFCDSDGQASLNSVLETFVAMKNGSAPQVHIMRSNDFMQKVRVSYAYIYIYIHIQPHTHTHTHPHTHTNAHM